MATCKSCRATIMWTKTEAGKAMPLDAFYSEDGFSLRGKFVLVEGGKSARAATAKDVSAGRPLWVSHLATCPDAPQHRKPR